MAISGQEPINVSDVENQSANSDSLFTAFHKIQNNFTTLFNAASPYSTIKAGNGITATADRANGALTITNTGVTSIVAGTGVAVANAGGVYTVSSIGNGNVGVTNVNIVSTSLNVTGSPIISGGTIRVDLPRIPTNDTFAVGTYTAPDITVDQFGRITAISNTTAVGTVTSVSLYAGDNSGIEIFGGTVTSSGVISIRNSGVTKLREGPGITLSEPTGTGDIIVSVKPSPATVSRIDITSNTLTVTGGGPGGVDGAVALTVDMPEDFTLTGDVRLHSLRANTSVRADEILVDSNVSVSNAMVVSGNTILEGQVDMGNSATVGANLTVAGKITIGQTMKSGYANIADYANIGGNINLLGIMKASNTTDANTSIGGTMAGAVQVSGGAHITKNLNVGNGIITGNILTSNLTVANIFPSGNISWGLLGPNITTSASSSIDINTTGTGWSQISYTGSDNHTEAFTDSSGFGITSNVGITKKTWSFAKTGVSTFPGNVSVTGTAAITGNITATGNVTANNATVTNNINSNNVILGNAVTISNTASIVFNTQTNNAKFTALQPPADIATGQGLYASNGQPGGSDFMFWNLPNSWGKTQQFMTTDGAGNMKWATVASSSAPATYNSTGTAGQIAYDATHIYICIATNSWIRASASTW